MAWVKETLETPSGAMLRLYTATANSAPKAVIQINHGMAEHAARYARFANALLEAGYAVYAHDHRGHGHTTAPGSAQGLFAKENGWAKVIADVDAVNAEIRSRHPRTPIICFGHSMGAIVALNYAMQHPDKIDALAPWNISVDAGPLLAIYRGLLKTERFFKGSDVPSTIAPKLTFEAWNKEFAPTRTDFDWLSRDDAEVDKYVADPLCGFPAMIGMWLDVTDGVRFAADDRNLVKLPKDLLVYLLAGTKDPVSLHGKAIGNLEKRMKAADICNVSFI
ncbi:MAG: lysophospholipase, partial [Rhizobiaceae bacterium]